MTPRLNPGALPPVRSLAAPGRRQATALPGLNAAAWQPHALHGGDAVWVEKNCYVDLWIELLHAQGLEPRALWPFALALDFEGDQFTFFKPPHAELRRLYGLDVQELTLWRPLAVHAIEHLAAGRLVSVEADAFWLPDVAGTDYRHTHAKTTIVLNDVDLDAQRLGYFHNAGYFELAGEDFIRTLQLDPASGQPLPVSALASPGQACPPLPLFAEFIRTDRRVQRATDELQALALGHLREHLAWCPADNPVTRLAERLVDEVPVLRERGLEHYHLWAFGSIRQLGAAFEFAAEGLRWQLGQGQGQGPLSAEQAAALAPVPEDLMQVARTAKTLILKMARAVASPRPVDLAPLLDEAAQAWQRALGRLQRTLG